MTLSKLFYILLSYLAVFLIFQLLIILIRRLVVAVITHYDKISINKMKGKLKLQYRLSKREDSYKEIDIGFKPRKHKQLLFLSEKLLLCEKNEEYRKKGERVVECFLTPKARKLSKSKSKSKLIEAARIFALAANKKDTKHIEKLLKHSDFHVRLFAARAAVKLGTKSLIYKILELQKTDSAYERAFYRDLLSKKATVLIEDIYQIAHETKKPKIRLSCLKFFEVSLCNKPLYFIENEIQKNSPEENQLAAIKVLAFNPQPFVLKYLPQFFKNKDSRFRRHACKIAKFVFTEENLLYLLQALNDLDWGVRLEAAYSLIAMKKKTRTSLALEKENGSDLAKQAIFYAEQFSK